MPANSSTESFCDVGVDAINAILAMDPEVAKAYTSELLPCEAEDVKFVKAVKELSQLNSVQAMKRAAQLWAKYGRSCRPERDANTEKVWDFLENDVNRTASLTSFDKISYCEKEAEWLVRQLAAVTLPRFLTARRSHLETFEALYGILPKTAEAWVEGVFASWVEDSCLCCVLADVAIPGAPILYANKEFYRSTEYLPEDIIGNNLSVLQGPKTQALQVERLRKALRTATMVQTVLVNYRKGKSIFKNMLTLIPLFDSDNNYRFVVGVQFDLDAMSTTTQTNNNFQQSPLGLKLIRLCRFLQHLPNTLPVPSTDIDAKRSMLRACLRTAAITRTSRNKKVDDDDDSDASSEEGDDEAFLRRRVQGIPRDYDGPDAILRLNGNVWISRCAWLVHWCAPTPSATSVPYEFLLPLSWDNSATPLSEMARAIDATNVAEAYIAELRREMMRSTIGGSVLGTLFGTLGTAKQQQQQQQQLPSESSPAPAPNIKQPSYREILAKFDDDVLARLVSSCSQLARQHSNLLNFSNTDAKKTSEPTHAKKKSLSTLLRAADSRRTRVSKIGILQAATAFHVHSQSPMLASITDHDPDDSEAELPPLSTGQSSSSRHSPRPSPVPSTKTDSNAEEDVSFDRSVEDETIQFQHMSTSSSSPHSSSMNHKPQSRRSLHLATSSRRRESRLVVSPGPPHAPSRRQKSRRATMTYRGSIDGAERRRTSGASHQLYSPRQSQKNARRATGDKRVLMVSPPKADVASEASRRASLAPQPCLLAQRPQSVTDQMASTTANLRCVESVNKEMVANAIMKPNNTREAEIKTEMDQLRETCGSALVDVLATPTLLANPTKFVANVRAQEEKIEGYPSWTMRTALCGAPGEELLASDGDTLWVNQFMPALGDALSSHGNIGLVGVDMRGPGLPLVYVNDGFTKLVKRPRSNVIGRNCNFLQQNPKGPTPNDPSQKERIAAFSAAIHAHKEHVVKLQCYDGFGEQFLCVVVVVPIRMPNLRDVAYTLGFQLRLTSSAALGEQLFALDCLLRNLPRTTNCDDMSHQLQNDELYASSARAPGCLYDVSIPLYIASWLALDVYDQNDGEDTTARRMPRWTATLELLLSSDATQSMLDDIVTSTCSIVARSLYYSLQEIDSIALLPQVSRGPALRNLFAANGHVTHLIQFDPKNDDDLADPAWLDSTWLALLTWRDAIFSHAARILLPVLVPAVHHHLHSSKSLTSRLSALELTGQLPSTHDATAKYLLFRQPTNNTKHFPTRAWASSMEAADIPVVLFRWRGDGDKRKVQVRSKNAEACRLEEKCGQTMSIIIRQLPGDATTRRTVWTVLKIGDNIADTVVQPIAELDGWSAFVVAGLDPKRRENDFKVAVRLIAVWSRRPPDTERRARFVEQDLTQLRGSSAENEESPLQENVEESQQPQDRLSDSRKELNGDDAKKSIGIIIRRGESFYDDDDDPHRVAEVPKEELRKHVDLTFQIAFSRLKMSEQCARQREALMQQICPIPTSLAPHSISPHLQPQQQGSLLSSRSARAGARRTTGRRHRRSDQRLCRLVAKLERELHACL